MPQFRFATSVSARNAMLASVTGAGRTVRLSRRVANVPRKRSGSAGVRSKELDEGFSEASNLP